MLPILLRALIPAGFMPMVGPGFSVQLVVCDGDGPVSAAAESAPMAMPMPMSMDMPPGMAMEPQHRHADHGSCPYGSAPSLGALPTLAGLPAFLIQRSVETALATAQVAYVEVPRRAQSPRGPPV